MANKDSTVRTFTFIGVLCVVCSLLVCVAVVFLQPLQAKQIQTDREGSILAAADFDLNNLEGSVSDVYAKNIEARLLDLATGTFVTDEKKVQEITKGAGADGYNFVSESKLPDASDSIPQDKDYAKIRTRAKYMPVYLVKNIVSGGYTKVILPFYGQGLWSTMYGYLAVEPDGNTIQGVKYYSHGETPGLGGEIENPKFTAQWAGKKLYGDDGQVAFAVVKKVTNPTYEVDALSGATLTSNGVSNSVKFWADEFGYGPFLKQLKNGGLK